MSSLRIKICGITREVDGEQAARLGADALGLNFYRPSPRYVAPAAVPNILRALPPFIEPVGLFAGQPRAEILAVLQLFGQIRTVQWHGDHPVVEDWTPYQLIPAFAVRDGRSIQQIEQYLEQCRAVSRLPVAVLVDAHVPGQYGGTGQPAPWQLLADFRPAVPLVLAGGLTPENVAEAVRTVRPYAVDVASGVESRPGVKDAEKMRRFIENARSA